jgi:hypothetical protein
MPSVKSAADRWRFALLESAPFGRFAEVAWYECGCQVPSRKTGGAGRSKILAILAQARIFGIRGEKPGLAVRVPAVLPTSGLPNSSDRATPKSSKSILK